MVSGNLAAVERISQEVLEVDPNVAQAHVFLGIVAQRRGLTADSIRHLTRAYELKPDSFDAATCLAAAYRISADLQKATPYAEQAVRLRPNDANAQMELGSIYLESLRLIDAENHLRRAVSLSGGAIDGLMALNHCLDRMGKPEQARQMVRMALQTNRIGFEELLNLGPAMLSQNNPTGALETSREAFRRAPNLPRAWAQLVSSLVDGSQGAEALAIMDSPEFSECFRSAQSDSETLAIVGMAFQSLGRTVEAREWLRRAIQASNPVGIAFYGYVHAAKVTDEDMDLVRKIESNLTSPSSVGDLTPLHFALGKALEDLGDYENAMVQYEAANNCERAQTSGTADFDRSLAPITVDDAIPMFTSEFIDRNSRSGIPSDLPIFVVGMIRSGTTLAEQILSSHPNVGGAGEQPFWSYNALDTIDLPQQAIRADRLRDAAGRYVALLASSYPGKLRVVDKMPVNFKYLGLLHLAFPNARFIHMRRNPVDTCVSIYSTHSRALTKFGNDKANLVETYRKYEAVMDRWRTVLPSDRLLEVQYEELVGNSEPTIRRMIEFCGLEWNDACLSPESNLRAVSTPSLWQVRRPINRSSVERWRRFEPWLGEFKELLPGGTVD